MRLHDRVAASTKPLRVALPGCGAFVLPGAAAIAAGVRGAPVRYVLDDDAAALVAHTGLAGAGQIFQCLDLVRIPAPLLWLEWRESGVLRAMAELGIRKVAAVARSPRVGLLVRSDPLGRRGAISIVWEGEGIEPDLSPVEIAFDLDDATFGGSECDAGVTVAVPQDEPLTRLLSHVRFRLTKEWDAYLSLACATARRREEALLQYLKMVTADFPFLAAFCLIMQARRAFAVAPSALDRLNVARAKAGKAPLLDHIEVTARIGAAGCAAGASRGVGGRAQARLHFVCGHLVRRGPSIFWRRAHMRGAAARGVIAARTVSVQTAQKRILEPG